MSGEPKPSWLTTLLRAWILVWLVGWQGGFAFYGGVVVPIGAEVIGSELEQGMVTQAVTHWLNAIGAIALLSWIAGWRFSAWQAGRMLIWVSGVTWSIIFAGWLALLALHWQMDQMIDRDSLSVTEPESFYGRHRLYLIISTAQWLGSLLLVVLTLRGWQSARS